VALDTERCHRWGLLIEGVEDAAQSRKDDFDNDCADDDDEDDDGDDNDDNDETPPDTGDSEKQSLNIWEITSLVSLKYQRFR
jgi:hypothetical protein